MTGAGAVAVDGDALAAELVGEAKDAGDAIDGGVFGEIYRFGDGGVAVLLKGGLHADVVFGVDFEGAAKEAFDVVGDFGERLEGAGLGDVLEKGIGVEAAIVGALAEDGIDLQEVRAGEDVSLINDGEDWLDAAGAIGEEREGAGGGDGGGGGVSLGAMEFGVPSGAWPKGERAAFVGELFGGVVGVIVEEVHDFAAEIAGGGVVVGELQEKEGVGESHEAQADFSVSFAHAVDAIDVVVIEVDDVVEETVGEADGVGEGVEVEAGERFDAGLVGVVTAGRSGLGCDEFGEVDGAEIAGFVGEKRLFAAGIGGFDAAEMRGHVVGVDAVDECEAGLAGGVGVADDFIPELGKGPEGVGAVVEKGAVFVG